MKNENERFKNENVSRSAGTNLQKNALHNCGRGKEQQKDPT